MDLNLGDLEIMSPAFAFDAAIPRRHADDGDGVSPPLEWRNVPDGTVELLLVMHDPDAPLIDGFTHWVVTGIDPASRGIAEGGTPRSLGDRALVGCNETGAAEYFGPAPPPGHGAHHYLFHLFALDRSLAATSPLTRRQALDAAADHVIVQARTVGTYENP